MARRGVALMFVKFILRINLVSVLHDPIACHLRNHTGGRDTEALAVAFDDCRLRNGKRFYGDAIDKRMSRSPRESSQGLAHRFVRGA